MLDIHVHVGNIWEITDICMDVHVSICNMLIGLQVFTDKVNGEVMPVCLCSYVYLCVMQFHASYLFKE